MENFCINYEELCKQALLSFHKEDAVRFIINILK